MATLGNRTSIDGDKGLRNVARTPFPQIIDAH